jgi:hypothetical protein
MQAIDKFKSDFDATLKRSATASEQARLEALRRFFFDEFRRIPGEVLSAFFTTFLEAWRSGEEKALAWLQGVSSLLLMEYDNTPFTREEWADIKESIVLGSEEIDLELLSYVMGLVLDHGAL